MRYLDREAVDEAVCALLKGFATDWLYTRMKEKGSRLKEDPRLMYDSGV